MDNRLTDFAIVAGLDAGHKNLPWDPGQVGGLLTGVDLKAIMKDPLAAEIIPALPVQPLYYALKRQGFEESLDVLPLLSQEQVIRMIDYDAWSQDRLTPKKLFDFLRPFGEVSSQQLYERFSELDEEYQLAALQGLVRIYEVDNIYDLSEDLQDRVRAMPCGKVFYEFMTEDQEDFESLDFLIEAAKEHNLRYAYSLLGHAGYLPPSEQEAQIAQFRKARLEEDGFVSFSESLELFAPVDRSSLRQTWQDRLASPNLAALSLPFDDRYAFLDVVLEAAREQNVEIDELFRIHQGLLFLANALCAAARVEPEDVQGLHRLLGQGKALVSLGLEYLAAGQVQAGIAIVRGEAAKTLFKVGIGMVEDVRQAVVEKMKRLGLPGATQLERFYDARQWGKILLDFERNWLDRIGLQANEILKGLFNRFPMYPLQEIGESQAPRIVFHAINGLAAYRELEISVAAILGTFACVVRSGFPLDQSFEVILREAAIQSLAQGTQGNYVNLEEEIPQLLQAWRDGLMAERDRWYVGDPAHLEEVLALISGMIHEGLHGLVILPRPGARPENSEEERI